MLKSEKPKLIFLSDLWGFDKSNWIRYYEPLEEKFTIKYYDCSKLEEVDKTQFTEQSIHQKFVNEGIETAINNLLKFEKEEINVVGFSIGGTIGWKASLLGLITKSLLAISSTRLRYETEKPNCKIELFFGEKDENRPSENWHKTIGIQGTILDNEDHKFYQKKEVTNMICQRVLELE